MKSPKRITAIKSLTFALLLAWGALQAAQAAPAGQVTNLSGPLFALGVDGARRVLSIGSQVDSGETLITEAKTYAQVRFIDKSVVTLKPDTHFKIDSFAFDDATPEKDRSVFSLVKGGLRALTGMIGKRGNQDAYRLSTATATIGIRGTIYDATYCTGDSCGNIPPGLYLAVTDGQVVVTNSAGVQTTLPVLAGQYVYVQSPTTPPVVLPSKPDIPFNPPPSFQTSQQPGQQAPTGGQQQQDCVVR